MAGTSNEQMPVETSVDLPQQESLISNDNGIPSSDTDNNVYNPSSTTSTTWTGEPTNLSPLLSPMTKMEMSLVQTLTDMNIRSQVQDCMNDMLLDIETTFYLNQELQVHANQHAVHSIMKQYQATVLEANAERLARHEVHGTLADHLVQDLMTLSRELTSLLEWKQTHQHKVEDYESLVAQLEQTQDELQTAQQDLQQQTALRRDTDSETDTQWKTDSKQQPQTTTEDEGANSQSVTTIVETDDSTTPISEQGITEDSTTTVQPQVLTFDDKDQQKPAADASPTPTVTQPDKEPHDTTTQPEQDTVAAVPPETPAVDNAENMQNEIQARAASTAGEMAPAAAVVTLDDDEPDERTPGLVDLEVEILMTIFGFIDAMDILNMAQINLSMYQKIDNIFGISEDGQSPPQPSPAPRRSPPPAAAPAPAPTKKAPPPSMTAPAPAAATNANAKPASTAAATTSPSLTGTVGPSGPIANRLFSMLQPVAPGSRPGAGKKSGMNPSVAQSLASKLTDAEQAAILSMSDKMNKMEKEVVALRKERETLAAKLDGTEGVKQFLINKVRDIELKLRHSREEEVKVTQQIASDQEVIAFLDSRVQELERQTEALTKDKSLAQSELDTLRVQSSKKITILSDMLKYEREKLKEEEGEWKATKKVLVKEVKNCRAQILALQAERDGLREQNEMLKRAVVSTGKIPRSTSPMMMR